MVRRESLEFEIDCVRIYTTTVLSKALLKKKKEKKKKKRKDEYYTDPPLVKLNAETLTMP